jgi:hypothetical protein
MVEDIKNDLTLFCEASRSAKDFRFAATLAISSFIEPELSRIQTMSIGFVVETVETLREMDFRSGDVGASMDGRDSEVPPSVKACVLE